MSSPIVFFDIAGPDSRILREFYSALFSWNISRDGRFSVSIISPTESSQTLMGSVRQDPAEKIFYVGVDDITAKLAEAVKKGGKIDQPRFEVSGVVILGIFKDPAGNRIGLVEMENNKVKIP